MKAYFAKLKYLFKWRDLAFTVVLFTIILSIAFCKAQNLVEVTFGEKAVDIASAKYSMNIPYDMIESVELAQICEDDKIVNARADMALRTGQWTNALWGEYSACIDMQTDVCVLVHLKDGRFFAFSSKSEEVTKQACQTLLDKIG